MLLGNELKMEQNLFNKKKIAFLTEAYTNIGYGHLYRCIALGEVFISKGFPVLFFLENEKEKETLQTLLPCARIWEKKEIKRYLKDHSENLAHLFVDVYHNHFKEYSYLEELEKPTTTTVIDAAFSGLALNTDMVFKVGFQEYQQKTETVYRPDGRKSLHFSGNDYFIFRKEFEKDFNYKCRQEAYRVLVTMGGSDPCQLTELVAEGLELIVKTLHVTYVLGRGFSDERFNELKRIHQQTIHNITYSQNISNMAETMAANDIAIINGGNTRFELALIGVPFLNISMNEIQNKISQTVSSYGVGLSAGIYSDLTPHMLKNHFIKLLGNVALRTKMSFTMKSYIKNKGTFIITNLISC